MSCINEILHDTVESGKIFERCKLKIRKFLSKTGTYTAVLSIYKLAFPVQLAPDRTYNLHLQGQWLTVFLHKDIFTDSNTDTKRCKILLSLSHQVSE